MRKKIFLMCVFFVITGCYYPGNLYVKSLNDWNAEYIIDIANPSQNIDVVNNNILPYMSIYIHRIPARKNEKECSNRFFELEFRISRDKVKDLGYMKFLNDNLIAFDTSKFYIVKDGKKYKINLDVPDYEQKKLIDSGKLVKDPLYKDYWDSVEKNKNDYTMNVSGMLLRRLESLGGNASLIRARVGASFILPFGCQSLEGTTLIIDGLYLNGKKLTPIEVKLSYLKNNK